MSGSPNVLGPPQSPATVSAEYHPQSICNWSFVWLFDKPNGLMILDLACFFQHQHSTKTEICIVHDNECIDKFRICLYWIRTLSMNAISFTLINRSTSQLISLSFRTSTSSDKREATCTARISACRSWSALKLFQKSDPNVAVMAVMWIKWGVGCEWIMWFWFLPGILWTCHD